jgi:anti-sigma regulatory factor (Ser/Thr protein kinase)
MPENVLDVWHYGFTEMFNNAIDHSGGTLIGIRLRKTATNTELVLYDDGIGIFEKIQTELNLLDERHAILELSKGKLTTDPANHTGEGIFFTSRMFDDFDILSGGVYFSHKFGEKEDWILERDKFSSGTAVWMKLNNHTARTTKKVFDQFTSDDDIGFTKTVVPVRLAQYGDDKLVSRSQAKRLLARVDRFKTVIFDFQSVDSIGQAFADEVFRVFALKHPEIELLTIKTNSAVKRMIRRARGSADS